MNKKLKSFPNETNEQPGLRTNGIGIMTYLGNADLYSQLKIWHKLTGSH